MEMTMTKINNKSDIKKLLAISLAVLILPVTGFSLQANAQRADSGEEDPHTTATGNLEIKTRVIDGFLYVKQTYTSNDLHQKYGFDQISREQIIPLPENYSGPTDETQVKTDVQLKLIHESETAKLQNYQKLKNNGLPMNGYEKWDVVVPDSTATTTQPVSLELVTHVPKWTSKSSSALVLGDPIDLKFDRVGITPVVMIDQVKSLMNSNGWTSSPPCGASDQYVLFGTTWKKQNAHEAKAISGCDQYHVRLWAISNDLVIGAAHKEYASLLTYRIHHIPQGMTDYWETGQTPGHVVDDFELGETQVRNTFVGKTCWSATSNNHLMSNSYTREYWQGTIQLLETATSTSYASSIARTC